MATTLYFRDSVYGSGSEFGKWSSGTNDTTLVGAAQEWAAPFRLRTSRGAAASSLARATVAGPTSGMELTREAAWLTAPLAADVTISGSITMNLRMVEDLVSLNAGAQVIIQRVDSAGVIQQTVANSEKGTELGTVETAESWSVSPTSTAFTKGDRIRVRVAMNDAGGTMAAGGNVAFWVNGPTASASGDSYLTFTETLTFIETAPTGTAVYLTDTASDVDPNGTAYDSKRAWTTRGSSGATAVVETATGWTAPLLWTSTAGGNFIEWYTPELQAVTLGGLVQVVWEGWESNALANVSPRCEIARCDAAGALIAVWAANTNSQEVDTTQQTVTFNVAGADTPMTDGRRLRIRFYADDLNFTPMASGYSATMNYNAATNGPILTFTQTLVEYSGATTVVLTQPDSTDEALGLAAVPQTYDIGLAAETNQALTPGAAGIVQNLAAVAMSSTEINLAWDAFAGATGYDVERDGIVIAEFVVPTEYFDTGLTTNTAYTYRVRAVT